MTANSGISIEAVAGQVSKESVYMTMSDEYLVDNGMDPSPGYWQRTLEQNVRVANFRYRHPVVWAKARVLHRIDSWRSALAYRITPAHLRDRGDD